MNSVSTRHFVRRGTATEKKLLTNGAVGLVLATLAIVLIVERLVNTHATVVAMLKVFGAPNTAETTFGAMIRLVFVGHPEIANRTMILSKRDVTFYASIAVLSWREFRNGLGKH